MTDEIDHGRAKARRQLLWMFGIAFAALGIAYAMFFFAKSSGGWGTTNNGEFVVPPLNTDALAVDRFETGGTWWLWMVTADCDAACNAKLEELRALHILLNREADRLSRGLLTDSTHASDDEHLHHFVKPNDLESGVYIIDPLGNFVLKYPTTTDPKPVLQDLKKLLRLSQIG